MEDNLQILKVEYLNNHRSDLPPILSLIYLFISITYIQLALGYYLQEYDKINK